MKKPVIQFTDYSFQYFSQAEPTLKNINLTVYEGEKILIVGPSGSGKSTLGNCLNGLIPFAYKGQTSGSLKICGDETSQESIFELSKKVGTVLQDSDGQFVGLTVGEDIAFTLENDCMEQSAMQTIVSKTANMVEMGTLLHASPFELSGGQKQSVALAGVMVNDVEMLLFDEPLANLDPATGKNAIDLIDSVQKKLNKTVIIIEHRLEDVLYRAVDRIIVVAEGTIVADMTPDELMAADILQDLGIREPLYVTALKYAGINISVDQQAGRFETLKLGTVTQQIRDWHLHQKPKKENRTGRELLRVENICFQYNKKRKILKNVSFSVKEGEMMSIVGTNGAGKSTLAKIICGFVSPELGDIVFNGVSLDGESIAKRSNKIGYVMQNPNQMLCKSMIYDEVALGLRIRGVSEEVVKEKVEKVLKICGLLPFQQWPISALSFGQKKRVTIASVLVMEPKMLILDEPTAGQDYHHYTEIMEFLKSLNEQGVTILMITHDMHLMLEYTDHAIVISNGEKIGDSSAVEILTNEEITRKANLKLTSLYDLGVAADIPDIEQFVSNFITYEREEVRYE